MRRFPAAFLLLLLAPALGAAEAAVSHAFPSFDALAPPSPADFRRRFGAAGPHLWAGLQRAAQIAPMAADAGYPNSLLPASGDGSTGNSLITFADRDPVDRAQFESFAAAAQRILADGITVKRTPDATSRWFDGKADAILDAVRAAEAAAGPTRSPEFEATVADLRIFAQLARFHARRAIAAVHYSLFKRGLRLAELYAATMTEKEAVAAWRELVAAAGDHYDFDLTLGARPVNLCRHWRGELKNLEFGLKQLEEQCCPPDEGLLQEEVWQPAPPGKVERK